jgi:WD40 repeat protein
MRPFRVGLAVVAIVFVTTWERPATTLSAQSDGVVSADFVALSRDGRMAATVRMALRGSQTVHVVMVHEMTNGTAVQQMTALGNVIVGLQISADGKHVLVIDATFPDTDGLETAQIFNTATGQEEAKWEHHNRTGHWCQFTSDGRSAVVAGMDSTLILWDLDRRKQTRAFRGFNASINAVSLSDDDMYVIAGGDDETARVWKTQSGELVQTFAVKKGRVLSVSVSRDGRFALTGSENLTLSVWRLPSGERLPDLETPSAVWSAALSPDNAFLAVGAARSLSLISMKDGVKKWTKTTESRVTDVAFSEDSKFLTSRDRWPRLYDTEAGQSRSPAQGARFWAVQFARFNPLMLYSWERGEFLLDLTTNKRVMALSTLKGSAAK